LVLNLLVVADWLDFLMCCHVSQSPMALEKKVMKVLEPIRKVNNSMA